jgi:tetratricopeptide (TPR) repeat protein
MRTLFVVLVFSALEFTFASGALGQARPGMPTTTPTQIAPQGPSPNGIGNPFASVTIIVADENGANLGQQALVKLSSNMTSTNVWGTTQDRSQIIFDQVPLADYEVEVSAAGFETTTKDLSVVTAQAYTLIVRLKRDDSGAVTNPVPGQLLAPKARKEVQKGLGALNAGNLNDAQKHFEVAYKLAPADADVDYLLGYLFMQKKDASQAQTYLAKAISLDPHHARALTAMGQLQVDQKDYAEAVETLKQLVAIDSGGWMGHWLLAEAYLHTKSFEKAEQQADLALQKGKAAAVRAEVIKGEALGYLGKTSEAGEAFEAFIKEAPKDPMVPTVREMIAESKESTGDASYKETSTSSDALLPALAAEAAPPNPTAKRPEIKVSIPLWRPPSVDDEKPVMASGTVCPSEQVIAGAGKRATELVDNVGHIDATEQLLHEELDPSGFPTQRETRKFDYIVTIAEVQPPALMIDEYRNSMGDRGDFPGNIATHGLHGIALVFHPLLRDDFQMTCEGLGQWHGQATWLVYFKQRADRPNRMMRYEFTNGGYSIPLKGRAWIAADTYQIVHLESDLVSPLPKIQLESQHQSVDYGMVHFSGKNTDLWLPKSAELYFDFRHHRYYRRHAFENYKLFSVGAHQKIGEPKELTAPQDTTKTNQ